MEPEKITNVIYIRCRSGKVYSYIDERSYKYTQQDLQHFFNNLIENSLSHTIAVYEFGSSTECWIRIRDIEAISLDVKLGVDN